MKQCRSLKKLAQRLTKYATPAEYEFQYRLKRAGIKFKWNWVAGMYIPDFVFMTRLLIIEVDGPRHDDPEVQSKDKRRDSWFSTAGFTTWRIKNDEVHNFDMDRIKAMPVRTASEVASASAKVTSWGNKARSEYRKKRAAAAT